MQESGSSDDDDMLGPALPGEQRTVGGSRNRGAKSGPAIPNIQDLELRRGKMHLHLVVWVEVWMGKANMIPELAQEDSLEQRDHLRALRHNDRATQKSRLDELVPRADAGTKDRMLEKKREKADSNRAFAAGKTEAGGVVDVPEADLLGGDDDGVEGFKRQKKEMERKKNEREIRRDEVLRARMAEREERVREYQEKERRTMIGLIALARERFGGGAA